MTYHILLFYSQLDGEIEESAYSELENYWFAEEPENPHHTLNVVTGIKETEGVKENEGAKFLLVLNTTSNLLSLGIDD